MNPKNNNFFIIIFWFLAFNFSKGVLGSSPFCEAYPWFLKRALHGVVHHKTNEDKHHNIWQEEEEPRKTLVSGLAKDVEEPCEKEDIEELEDKDTSGIVHVAREFTEAIIRGIA